MAWKHRLAPDRVFVALASIFGLAFAVLTAPLQVADEGRHLARAYVISQGQFLAEPFPGEERHGLASVQAPESVLLMELRLGTDISHNPAGKQDVGKIVTEFSTPLRESASMWRAMPSMYSPLPYIPQAVTIGVLKPLGAPPILFVYAGRAVNLAVFVALVCWAIRLAPAHRWILALLALTPMTLFQAASLSADALTNALAFLWICVVLRWRRSEKTLEWFRIGVLWLLVSALGLCKPVYWVLGLAVLIVPASRFRGTRHRLAVLAIVLVGGLIPLALWNFALSQLELPLRADHDPLAQLQGMLSDPLGYGLVLARTLVWRFTLFVRTWVGVLGYLDTPLPVLFYFLHPVVLAAVALFDTDPRNPLDRSARLILTLTAAACWVAIMTVSYVGFTAVGADMVTAQGRYFIPFAPLLLLSLHLPRAGPLPAAAAAAAGLYAVVVLATSVLSVVFRYYVG